jgi:hypothetical protein
MRTNGRAEAHHERPHSLDAPLHAVIRRPARGTDVRVCTIPPRRAAPSLQRLEHTPAPLAINRVSRELVEDEERLGGFRAEDVEGGASSHLLQWSSPGQMEGEGEVTVHRRPPLVDPAPTMRSAPGNSTYSGAGPMGKEAQRGARWEGGGGSNDSHCQA